MRSSESPPVLTSDLPRLAPRACLVGLTALLVACGGGGGSGAEDPTHGRQGTRLRIYHNPYREVDWTSDFRLKAQHHDHLVADLPGRLQAYDVAGYDAVSLMDYSGAPRLAYALKNRLWTPEMVVPPDVLASMRNVTVFLPNAEEVGLPDGHYTSAFLTRYIEHWEGSSSTGKQPWHYSDVTELGRVVTDYGGVLLIAHAWSPDIHYYQLPLVGVEIYNPVAEFKRRQGDSEYTSVDRTRILIENWDRGLARNYRLIGIAVNDHFGPYRPIGTTDDDLRDSGKVIVFSKSRTLEGYESAFRRRALLAVKDLGRTKDLFPVVRSITQDDSGITIDVDDVIRWISHGSVIASGRYLPFSALPMDSRYVRAEVQNTDGSIVYTQAFSVRPVGDSNGDGVVNTADETICADVTAGRNTDPEQVAACEAART